MIKLCTLCSKKLNKNNVSGYCKPHRHYSEEFLKYKKEYQSSKKYKKYFLKYSRNYRKNNKDKIKQYTLSIKDKRREYIKNYVKNKRKTDILFNLKGIIRTRVLIALRRTYWKKNSKIAEYLGCSLQELKQYLENLFKPGMTWENHGLKGWHIDHIKPLSSAKSIEELYELCHYSNLQPLWAIENISKGSKIKVDKKKKV